MHPVHDTVADAFSDFGFDSFSASAVPVVSELPPASAPQPDAAPAPVKAGSVSADALPDPSSVPTMSIKDLRHHLTRLGVGTVGCVEKSDFQARLVAALEKQRRRRSSTSTDAVPPVPQGGATSTASHKPQAPSAPAGGASFNINPWEVAGFHEFAPPPTAAAPAPTPALAPAYVPHIPTVTVNPNSASAAVAMHIMTVPLIPRSVIGAAIPYVCIAPVLKEVPVSYFSSCITEKPLPSHKTSVVGGAPVPIEPSVRTSPALGPAGAPPPADRSQIPYTPAQAIGGRRMFELLLRPDVSTQDVLNAFASAATAVGT